MIYLYTCTYANMLLLAKKVSTSFAQLMLIKQGV